MARFLAIIACIATFLFDEAATGVFDYFLLKAEMEWSRVTVSRFVSFTMCGEIDDLCRCI